MDVELKMVRGELENLQGVFGIYTTQESNEEIVHPLIIGGDVYAIKDFASKDETNATKFLNFLTEKVENSRNIYFTSKGKISAKKDILEFMPGDILKIEKVIVDKGEYFNYEFENETDKALSKMLQRAANIYFSYYQSQEKFEEYTIANFTDILKKEIEAGRKYFAEGNLEKLTESKTNIAEHLKSFGLEKDSLNIIKMIEFSNKDSEWIWPIYKLMFDSCIGGDKKSEKIYREAIEEEITNKMNNWNDFPFKI